ncbi:GyrI-like domain-containing protein [Actinomadura rudentiformis]|uniref:GyrI-like domain-containing protein n=1 Tax=Actinomadura rudentiformis TaxID=359158 RepID=A0A6H9YWZ6_9ACTN|nr:GyrI-like domain-containing protein [Actinomadura rudentiformis]KAB2349458.1 GyrI-like domain-containing protein [Actinomadura rudentiformis]
MSIDTPEIKERAEQPYVAVKRWIAWTEFPVIADRLPEIIGWLAARGIQPAGAPFFRYVTIGGEQDGEVEAGVPVAAPVEGEGDIYAGVLPPGRYASVTHVGHPDQLAGVTTDLLGWAAEQGLTWDMSEDDEGEHWACRLELYHSDPAEQPDMGKWETELAFKLAG